MLDRIAGIVLVVLGAVLLVLLVLGLAVSCRPITAEPEQATSTPFVDFATTTPIISPTPLGVATPGGVATPIPGGTLLPGTTVPGATATPTSGATAVPGPTATPTPGETTVPGATTVPGPTITPTSGGAGLTPGATIQHVVSRGEWLLQIARCYGTSYQSVLAANRIANPDFILPGWIITVPAIGSQGTIIGSPCVIAHIVTTGDTWESLAARQGTTVAILQRANPGALSVGRAIWVPRVP
jgi:LysM repeat protein